MWEQKLVDSNSFSFFLTQTPGAEGSKMILGGINPDYAETPFNYFKLTSLNYWRIAMDSMQVGDNTVAVKMDAVIDTGTSVIFITVYKLLGPGRS